MWNAAVRRIVVSSAGSSSFAVVLCPSCTSTVPLTVRALPRPPLPCYVLCTFIWRNIFKFQLLTAIGYQNFVNIYITMREESTCTPRNWPDLYPKGKVNEYIWRTNVSKLLQEKWVCRNWRKSVKICYHYFLERQYIAYKYSFDTPF